jgi:signal peptidase
MSARLETTAVAAGWLRGWKGLAGRSVRRRIPDGPPWRVALTLATGGGLAALGIAAVMLLLAVVVLTRLFGWHFVVVSGSSMEPTIPYGSIALMRPASGEDVGPGDIVQFRAPGTGTVTTHRIVEQTADGSGFITRGDNSFANDQLPVPGNAITARYVFSVPFAGYAVRALRTPAGYLSLIMVPGIIIALMEASPAIRGRCTWLPRPLSAAATARVGARQDSPAVLPEEDPRPRQSRHGPFEDAVDEGRRTGEGAPVAPPTPLTGGRARQQQTRGRSGARGRSSAAKPRTSRPGGRQGGRRGQQAA